MPYLQRRSIAFGTYIAPRERPHQQRRQVRFAGHYGMQWIGLGSLGDADWSGFITTLQNAILPAIPFLPIGRLALQSVLGTTSPSPSQINPSVANQLILALGRFQLSGAAGAYRDALWRQLQQYVANPPQLPAPAAPAPAAPVSPAPIISPAAPITPSSPVTTASGAPVVTSSGSTPSWASAVAGTPVPLGYPITQIFVDPSGNQWMFNATAGVWQNATQAASQAAIASEQAQAAQIAAATATSPGGPESPTLVTSPVISPSLPNQPSLSPVNVSVTSAGSGYSDVLNWLTESTLISVVPNWVVVAGGALVAFKLSGKGHLL